MVVADVLDKTADLIEMRGLNQNGLLFSEPYDDGKCPLCTTAAFLAILKQTGSVNGQSYLEVSEPLRIVVGHIAVWSDCTPQSEVIATLRNLAHYERSNRKPELDD